MGCWYLISSNYYHQNKSEFFTLIFKNKAQVRVIIIIIIKIKIITKLLLKLPSNLLHSFEEFLTKFPVSRIGMPRLVDFHQNFILNHLHFSNFFMSLKR